MERGYKRNVSIYYISFFFASLIFTIPVWVAYYRQFLTFTQMSLMTSAITALSMIIEIPTGAFADLSGRKVSVIVGSFLSSLGLVVISFATSGLWIVIGAILGGIGGAFISGAHTALLYESLKELGVENTYGKIQSKSAIIEQVAIILASIGAGYLFTFWKGLPFFVYGLSVFISGILYFFIYEPKMEKISSGRSFKDFFDHNKLGMRETFKDISTRNFSIFYALVGGLVLSWQGYFNQIYASSIGYSEVGKGWLFAIIRFVNAILILRLLHLEKFITKKNVFLFFPILILVSALPAILPLKPLGTILLFTMTLGNTLRYVVLDNYANDAFDSKYRSTALSTLSLYVSIVYIGFITVGGPFLDRFPAGVWYFSMGIFALLFILPQGIKLAMSIDKKDKNT